MLSFFSNATAVMLNSVALGHEGASVIVSVGSNIAEFKPGSYVTLLGTNACYTGSCSRSFPRIYSGVKTPPFPLLLITCTHL